MLLEAPAPRARRTGVRAKVPPLENGDRLTSAEFLRRSETMPDLKKAELIDGYVHIMQPLSTEFHAEPDGILHVWLGTCAVRVPGLKFLPNPTLLLDADNAPQPDSVLCTTPRRGHRIWLNEKGYLCGRPELVCEVAASSASIDLHKKLHMFRRGGISEYLVWVVAEDRVCWFELVEDEYVELKPRNGILESRVFPKLALDVKALIKRDGAKVLATLERRLASKA